MKKPPLVEITWLDARTFYERKKWSKIAECALATQVTVGYLAASDDAVTRVAAHVSTVSQTVPSTVADA